MLIRGPDDGGCVVRDEGIGRVKCAAHFLELWGVEGRVPPALDGELERVDAVRRHPRVRYVVVELPQPRNVLLLGDARRLRSLPLDRIVQLLQPGLQPLRAFLAGAYDVERHGDLDGALSAEAVVYALLAALPLRQHLGVLVTPRA